MKKHSAKQPLPLSIHIVLGAAFATNCFVVYMVLTYFR